MVICLERDEDLHMAQLTPLPRTVSCFSKIQIGFTFLGPAHPGSPRKRAIKRACVIRLLHGSENWPVRKENVVALQRAEMRMVRWMRGRFPSKELRERD